jgi:phenylalanyl-tRNA synthetase beta chain
VSAADVASAFETIKSRVPLLKQVDLFDLYTGEQVGAGRKSLAYSLLYQAEDRTLTDPEVNAVHREVVERLRQTLGAEVRGAEGGEVGS